MSNIKHKTVSPNGSEPLASARQEAFAQALTSCPPCSASEAWRRAGYSPNNADVKAARALVNVGIAARISYLRQQNAKACEFKKEDAIALLCGIACGTVVEAKSPPLIRDRIRAIDSLAKLCGWNTAEKVETVDVVHIVRHDDGRDMRQVRPVVRDMRGG